VSKFVGEKAFGKVNMVGNLEKFGDSQEEIWYVAMPILVVILEWSLR
jgi:hypothetical protein